MELTRSFFDSTRGRLTASFGAGLAFTAAFPIVLPATGPTPVLDWAPRELLVLPAAAYFFALARMPARRFRWAFLTALVHFTTLLFWLGLAMVDFARMPLFQAVPAVALLAAYCSLYLAAVPDLAAWLFQRVALPRWILFPAAVVATEWARTHWLTGFPWGVWGYSQARNLPLANLAAFGGVYLVSAVIALAAALLVERRSRSTLLGVLICAHVPGTVRMIAYSDPPTDGVQVALLQGNIRQDLKNRGTASGPQVAQIYRDLLREAESARVDLALWPESSWPYPHSMSSPRFSVNASVPMIVGLLQTAIAPGGYRAFNSSIYVEAEGEITGSQHKQHLVPFGEYVPLRWLLPVEKVVPGMIDLTPGEKAEPLGPHRVGVQICYDGIFPELGRAHARSGAELLANLTNDGWYGISSGPFHHRDFYVFRAIETDRFVLRATNTGVSAVIGPRGRIRAQSRLGTSTVLRGVAYRRSGTTPYVRLGEWVPILALALVCAAVLASLRDRLRRLTAAATVGETSTPDRGEHHGTQ